MQLDVRQGQDYVLVRFKNNCNLNQNNTEDFKSQVLNSVAGNRLVILDFTKLDYIDSAGLTMLIYMRRQLLDRNGVLRLAGVGNRIKKLMQITRLHRILDIYPTVEDAVKNGKKVSEANLSDHPLNLRFQVKHTNDYSLIKLSQPDSLIAANHNLFEKKVAEYLKKHHRLILNFDQIRNIDSAGIASLIRLKERSKEEGNEILLVTNNTVLDRLFKLYAMEELFPKFKNNDQAIKSLQETKPKRSPVSKKPKAKPVAPEAVTEKDDPLAELQYDDILFLEAQQK